MNQDSMATRKMVFSVIIAGAVIVLALVVGSMFRSKANHNSDELDKSYKLLD